MQFPRHHRLHVVTFFAVAIGVLLAPAAAHAVGTCTWSGGAGDNKWSTAGNWTAGGGGSCPPNGIAAQFTGGAINCNIDVNATPSSISIAGYNGIVTQQSGMTVTLSGAYTQSTGTFVGGDSAIDMSGAFNLSGGTFKVTSGRMSVGGQFNATGGTFTAHPAGTYVGRVVLKSTTSQTFASNGISFNDLYLNDGLAGYWKLDDASGTNAVDSSGYGNTGALTNGPTWATSSLPGVQFTDPAGATFNGSNNFIDIPAPAVTTNAAFSVCAWVKFSAITAVHTMVSQRGTNSSAFVLKRDGSGKFAFAMTGSDIVTPTVYQSLGTTTPVTGTWYHVCGVYNGSTVQLYVNGTAEGPATTVVSPWNAVGHTQIGAVWWDGARADYVPGTIDDVRIYKRALSASEINSLGLGNQPGTSVATQTMTGSPTVTGDLTIASGTLAIGTNTLSVNGSWWNYGGLFTATYGAGGGTVAFAGTGTTNYILSAGQVFPQINVTGTGTWTLADNVDVDPARDITMSAGTLSASSYTLRGSVGGGAGAFTAGTGTLILDASSNVTLNATSLNNVRVEDPAETNLVGYWKLDEGQGTRTFDWSGNNHAGTATGGANWTSAVPGSSRVEYYDPYAVTLDGSTGYVDVGTAATTSNAAFTACAWV